VRSIAISMSVCLSDFVNGVMFAYNRPGKGDANMTHQGFDTAANAACGREGDKSAVGEV